MDWSVLCKKEDIKTTICFREKISFFRRMTSNEKMNLNRWDRTNVRSLCFYCGPLDGVMCNRRVGNDKKVFFRQVLKMVEKRHATLVASGVTLSSKRGHKTTLLSPLPKKGSPKLEKMNLPTIEVERLRWMILIGQGIVQPEKPSDYI
ncbi:hypothetical protein ACLOJK_021878, partial [Asimina triloba]